MLLLEYNLTLVPQNNPIRMMWPMIQIEFTKEEIERLHHEHLRHSHPRVRQRCEVVYLKALGFSHKEIGRITRLSQPTVRSYLEMYRDGELEKLKELNFYTPTSELDAHREEIEAEFEARPPATANEAAERIEKLTGICRSPTQVREFLERMGMKWRSGSRPRQSRSGKTKNLSGRRTGTPPGRSEARETPRVLRGCGPFRHATFSRFFVVLCTRVRSITQWA